MKNLFLLIILILLIGGFYYRDTLMRLYHGYQGYRTSKERAKHYQLEDLNIEDITSKLSADPSIPDDLKQPLIKGERRIVIFKYLSGSEYVAGYLSYLTKGEHPLLVFLRGGNGYYGIMRPNNRFSFLEGYNVVGTLYRGNIYGGDDEWGGKDVQDVENLIRYLPELENFTHVDLKPPFGMIGVSRGAMEMFAALSQSEYLKSRVTHAVSVSGCVDLDVNMSKRPEMKYLFLKKFKEQGTGNFAEWIHSRNPVSNVAHLPKSLKVLLVYGLDDNQVFLEEQQNLQRALEAEGIDTELVTIPGAQHGLLDHFKELETLLKNFMKTSRNKG